MGSGIEERKHILGRWNNIAKVLWEGKRNLAHFRN